MIAGMAPPMAVEQYTPTISAIAVWGCMEKAKGMKTANAILSFRPGMEPMIRPPTTPIVR